MNLVALTVAFVLGIIVGIGFSVFYFNYKVNKQIGTLEEHMEDIDEMMEMGIDEEED